MTTPIQQTINGIHRPSLDARPSSFSSSAASAGGEIERMAAESPVLVVGRRGCCMIHAVTRLLQALGVNPVVYEVEEGGEEAAVLEARLSEMVGGSGEQCLFPAVFIGGRLMGGIDRLMAIHISGDLVPVLKEAGALWL